MLYRINLGSIRPETAAVCTLQIVLYVLFLMVSSWDASVYNFRTPVGSETNRRKWPLLLCYFKFYTIISLGPQRSKGFLFCNLQSFARCPSTYIIDFFFLVGEDIVQRLDSAPSLSTWLISVKILLLSITCLKSHLLLYTGKSFPLADVKCMEITFCFA